MSKATDKIKILAKACKEFKSIEYAQDLRIHKLTFNDYCMVFDILKKLNGKDCKGVLCISKSVADWFRRNGFIITPPEECDSINYYISLNGKFAEINI